ncbi:hypothetical protein R5R35_003838 [Gryllus longicercus]|uniref:TGF-beta family profile domain-containing protein n=1 Tax=Gryllus longicercus TaxID=2509291 RepID=A0AAN9VLS5_9ORTH
MRGAWLRWGLPAALLVTLTMGVGEGARAGAEPAVRHNRQHNKNDSHNGSGKRNIPAIASTGPVSATAPALAPVSVPPPASPSSSSADTALGPADHNIHQCPNCNWEATDNTRASYKDGGGSGGGRRAGPAGTGDNRRLEFIKRQILSKLGLKAKPNVTVPVPRDFVLETLYRAGETTAAPLVHKAEAPHPLKIVDGAGEEAVPPTARSPDSEPDDFYGRTSEIITFAEKGKSLNGQTLLEFPHFQDLEGDASGSELRVKAATFWVRVDFRPSVTHPDRLKFRDRNLTLFLFKVKLPPLEQQYVSDKEFDDYTEMAASLPVAFSALGWQKFDLTSTVREWYASGAAARERLRLLVDCSGCSDKVEAILFGKTPISSSRAGQPRDQQINQVNSFESEGGFNFDNPKANRDSQRPFLVVHTDSIATKRVRRRALDCVGDTVGQCCKQKFYVNFTHLGWDDWIIAPRGYYANYCQGDCGGVHRTPDTYQNYHTHVMEEIRKVDPLSGMQPCCAPLKFSSMSLIYFSPDSNIIKRDLPKMVVDECGCP